MRSGDTPASACSTWRSSDPYDDAKMPIAFTRSVMRRSIDPMPDAGAHSEGEIVLAGADPLEHPEIRMNYLADPRDMPVMIAVIRRALDVVASWPPHRRIGPLLVPPFLAARHGHIDGERPSDGLLEDFARHYATTVYHLTSTCRIGSIVDPRLRMIGVANLRVADASIMPKYRERQHQRRSDHDRRKGR
jgi:choline dehydrogenase-like flavoprotein